jgi:enterochelin esterase-like enzyme
MAVNAEALIERARAESTPLISEDQATFVWAGERAPVLAGDMTGWMPREATAHGQKMEEVEPGVWACTLTLPPDAYVEYVYFLDGRRVYDPLNPRRVSNGFGEMNNCFWMPQAPQSTLFRRQRGVKPGVVKQKTFQSMRLAGGRRTVRLYRPACSGSYLLLLVLDGRDYFQRARLATLADNLIHQGAIPPLTIAFLDNARQARFTEYGCSEALVGFTAQELVPWVASEVSLVQQPGAHGVLGASLGGLAALWLGVRLPEVFGQVFSQAGGFALGFSKELGLTTLLRLSERLPLRIYLDCGRFDPLLEANRMMKELLEARGYDLCYREFNAGHNYPAWREELATGLTWLFRSGGENSRSS